MSTPNSLSDSARTIYEAFRARVWLWMAPTLLFAVAAIGYTVLRTPVWEASQSLIVRDEAIGNLNPQGRFNSIESMRAFQETVLEVARSRASVVGALKALGPDADRTSVEPWPSDKEIQKLQEEIRVSAPKGAEFGSTEVIYLSVRGKTRSSAIARTRALCDQLEQRLRGLRNSKAQSVITELQQTLDLAMKDLENATSRLEAMEREVGSDLGELRILNDSGSGISNLSEMLNEVKAELRQVGSTYQSNQQLHDLLESARKDPDQLLATPATLLVSQPTLARLKEGLVDAQLRTSELRGSRSDHHPSVLAAMRAEDEVRQNIVAELSVALRGIQSDLLVSEQRMESLRQQQASFQERLDELASLRARYGNLVGDAQQRTAIANQAKQNLADAIASQSAAKSTSLLTRFQSPVAGDRPLGPRRLLILAAGLFGGLVAGAGLVFLTLPNGQTRGRRWSDFLPFGRRASDRDETGTSPGTPRRGRRAHDAPQPAPSTEGGRRDNDPEHADRPAEDAPRNAGRRADDAPAAPARRGDDLLATPVQSARQATEKPVLPVTERDVSLARRTEEVPTPPMQREEPSPPGPRAVKIGPITPRRAPDSPPEIRRRSDRRASDG